MHPAYSVILFTTASGAGYGLLVGLALGALAGRVPLDPVLGLAGFAIAFALITAGLLASTAHLGRPERAWRAFSQWRTSWLSREGVLALATYVPAGLLALGWVVIDMPAHALAPLAVLTSACAVLTLYTTGMIYASLRTIRQWHQPLTAPLYIVLGLASGAVLLNALLVVFGHAAPWSAWLAIAALALAALLKAAYWHAIDAAPKQYTVEAATGLGHLGKVRPLEPPHTLPNFVMREMGYRVARKHAEKLRTLVLACAFALPALATLAAFTPSPLAALAGALVAVLSMAIGLVVERWLFFAEAEHVAMLYYGADAA
jgi:sulfite dehydrogenase (quinone) subunit SoeC